MTQTMTQTMTGTSAMRLTADLRAYVAGDITTADDERYEHAGLSWHRAVEPRPDVIVDAAGVADIVMSVRVANERGVRLSTLATGHGTCVAQHGGIMLRTSALAGVSVDPVRRLARAEAGALWTDVIAAAAPYGLAPLSGTPGLGVVGYTLGGGAGWLARQHGYAADSVSAFEVVTSDGVERRVTRLQHPDLFWALRGGGGGFAVVTALEFALYPVGSLLTGTAMYPVGRAPEVFAAYRDWAETEPDSLNTSAVLMQVPPTPQCREEVRGKRVLALRMVGVAEGAADAFTPVTAAAGPPLIDGFAIKTFAQAAADEPTPPPTAMRQRFEMFDSIPSALLDEVMSFAEPANNPSPFAVELRHWGGAMARPPSGHGPIGHRDVPFSMNATVLQSAPGDGAADRVADFAARVRPYATGGSFRNFETNPLRTAAAYTADDYRRLKQIKATWDPDNLFGAVSDIAPVAANEEER